MAEEVRLSRAGIVLFGLAVVVVAVLGMAAAYWLFGKRQADAYERRLSAGLPSMSLLKKGDEFPSIELINTGGEPVNTANLIAGHKAIIVTLSPGCEPCALLVDSWKSQVDKIPRDLKIIGITSLSADQTLNYMDKTGFPFEMYCDTTHVLAVEYGLGAFPSIIGVDEVGRIVFVGEGWADGFGPEDAYRMIAEADEE